jgi:PAS domain S-box-containing protein
MIDILETERIKEAIANHPADVLKEIETSDTIGICITNSHGNFVAVNSAYTKIYGYGEEELIGKSFLMVVPPTNKETMDLLHKKFLRDKKEIAREWGVITKGGDTISISVDTAFSDKIFDHTPHKITFVHRES